MAKLPHVNFGPCSDAPVFSVFICVKNSYCIPKAFAGQGAGSGGYMKSEDPVRTRADGISPHIESRVKRARNKTYKHLSLVTS